MKVSSTNPLELLWLKLRSGDGHLIFVMSHSPSYYSAAEVNHLSARAKTLCLLKIPLSSFCFPMPGFSYENGLVK